MHKYRLISKKGEGTFSEVLKAQSIKSGKQVAIKCMKNHFDSIDQVNNLREIQALRRLAGHPNIIKLHEVLYDEPTGRLALVFELMDMNLYEAIKGRRHYLPEQKVKQYMYAMLKSLDHMHRNGIFHRDVKPENLLVVDEEIKLADLGSCRGIYSRQPFTEYISTRWYRAPECLLTDGYYNFKMDLFAAGCVAFETIALFPLFPGQNEMDQVQKIHNILGTPSPEFLARKFKRNASHMDFNFPEKKGSGIERLIPHADVELTELVKKLTRYDPDERILARQALKDPIFRELREAEKDPFGSPPVQSGPATVGTGSKNRDGSLSKAGMSSSSSAASIVDREEAAPEQTASEAGVAGEERSASLPNIGHERRKKSKGQLGLGGGGGGASSSVANREVGERYEEEGTVLPPIGGIKGKRDGKSMKPQTFKNAANAALQKPGHATSSSVSSSVLSAATYGPSHPFSSSKGFSGTVGSNSGSVKLGGPSATSLSSTDVMTSSNPHGWGVAGKDQEDFRGNSRNSNAASSTDKMNSTWTASTQPQRYVSGFGAKNAPPVPGIAPRKS